MTRDTLFLRISGLAGALGVGLGAFGAHGLRGLLERNGTAATWETAVLYHLVHAAVLLALALSGRGLRGPFHCILAGIVIFSGSLYILSVTNMRWLGAITPIGGLSMLAGWFWLVFQPQRNHAQV
jgi:uncharacterized membrane protein YgdD (TMEM256/DUF423 family)